jgi:hypothetical protein
MGPPRGGKKRGMSNGIMGVQAYLTTLDQYGRHGHDSQCTGSRHAGGAAANHADIRCQ